MVTAVALVFFLLLFYCFGFYFLPPFAFFLFSFLFRWLSDMDSVLGIRVGGVLLFFTMSCNNPITPKRFYFFYYYFYFLPLDSDSYFLLACSPILYILFAAKAAALPVCLSAITNGVHMFLFQRLVWVGSCS